MFHESMLARWRCVDPWVLHMFFASCCALHVFFLVYLNFSKAWLSRSIEEDNDLYSTTNPSVHYFANLEYSVMKRCRNLYHTFSLHQVKLICSVTSVEQNQNAHGLYTGGSFPYGRGGLVEGRWKHPQHVGHFSGPGC
jgi:hypothetical protein